jgi:trehalose-6-phosphate synthase
VYQSHRIIIVANRLPVSGGRDEKTGEWNFRMSSGGLVTALQGTREDLNALWIGWLGQEIPVQDQPIVREMLLRDYNAVPVFISDELAARYYNGFSNDVLWPLFHYIPLPIYKSAAGNKRFDNSLWEAYKEANVAFADVIGDFMQEGDYVWVHDYQLMWLPYELRQRYKRANIGWFLHTPFPSSEIYRILPVRKALLEGEPQILACECLVDAEVCCVQLFYQPISWASTRMTTRGTSCRPVRVSWRSTPHLEAWSTTATSCRLGSSPSASIPITS